MNHSSQPLANVPRPSRRVEQTVEAFKVWTRETLCHGKAYDVYVSEWLRSLLPNLNFPRDKILLIKFAKKEHFYTLYILYANTDVSPSSLVCRKIWKSSPAEMKELQLYNIKKMIKVALTPRTRSLWFTFAIGNDIIITKSNEKVSFVSENRLRNKN